ncbi:TerB family tellurite resistance protein [Rubripirellula tenax]|uniref:TerB family tellurite resistance protein n=1 Tax=Rubripirellula tenax TaxID=2528015 RepID=UPI0011B732ED|nr:TerB family tellurite resistance protein [Rubripirellula tenax]
MFEQDEIHRRGKALEDEFFYQVDQRLGMELRSRMEREDAIERLKAATGFEESTILEHLVDAGFKPSSITALALVPMVFVAWADGKVDSAEQQAILSDALHLQVRQPDARALLKTWLKNPPGDELWSHWAEYSLAVFHVLPLERRETLRDQIVRSCNVVAEASGGHFGRGKTSAKEKVMLERIEKQLRQCSVSER